LKINEDISRTREFAEDQMAGDCRPRILGTRITQQISQEDEIRTAVKTPPPKKAPPLLDVDSPRLKPPPLVPVCGQSLEGSTSRSPRTKSPSQVKLPPSKARPLAEEETLTSPPCKKIPVKALPPISSCRTSVLSANHMENMAISGTLLHRAPKRPPPPTDEDASQITAPKAALAVDNLLRVKPRLRHYSSEAKAASSFQAPPPGGHNKKTAPPMSNEELTPPKGLEAGIDQSISACDRIDDLT